MRDAIQLWMVEFWMRMKAVRISHFTSFPEFETSYEYRLGIYTCCLVKFDYNDSYAILL